jgi:ubiquinone/menaquinone biosynthesis C-methylase UbiE
MNKIDFDCPICKGKDFTVLYEDDLGNRLPTFNYDFSINGNKTFRIVKCTNCSHCYATPRSENIYVNYDGNVQDDIYLRLEGQRLQTDKKVIKEIIKIKPNQSKLLDIGCATGDFLSVAQNYFLVEGLELSTWSTAIARKRGFIVHQKLIKDLQADNQFDIITLWGVIEHFEFPNDEIRNINRLLKTGGIVALWTGDIDTIFPKLIGKKWWYFQGQHIQMFTKKSITLLFEQNGFKKIQINKYPYVISTESLINTLKRYPFIRKTLKPLLEWSAFKNFHLTLRLPGEMFAIFEKTQAL